MTNKINELNYQLELVLSMACYDTIPQYEVALLLGQIANEMAEAKAANREMEQTSA